VATNHLAIRDGALVLADGSTFEGELIGAEPAGGVTSGEVVFNTVMSGYQEVISDPSYAGQIITFTTAHLGNYGRHARRRRGFARLVPRGGAPRSRPASQQLGDPTAISTSTSAEPEWRASPVSTPDV